jgi:hypothetical protein
VKKTIIIFTFAILVGCSHSPTTHIATIKNGTDIIEGDITGTEYNDTIRYYNLAHTLIRKSYFNHGIQEGLSSAYYANGSLLSTTYFSDGLKNGYNSYFDSSGICYYRDFYYYGLPVGPIVHFDKSGNPKRYFFISLQNETLLDIDYRDWHGVKDIYDKCINFISQPRRVDTTQELSILLYLITVPRFSFNYSILKKKKTSQLDFIVTLQVKSRMPFVQLTFPILPTDEQYTVGLEIYDSVLNKKTTVYKDL